MLNCQQQLDARNSNTRPKLFEEEAAALFFNNSAFVPTALLLPSLHSDFADAILLCLEDMPRTITPEGPKSRMANSRTKLMEVIHCWELSSNGFGQHIVEDDEFGHLTEENFMDDNCSSFIRSYHSHILYLWHLSNK
jgi:hypothetical protein